MFAAKSMPMPFITLEGSEGCGKSTQVELLAAHLQKRGIATVVFREPGGTAIGEAIRHLLQHSEDNRVMVAETELLLFEASRSQLVREKIQPALARGECVICDRFFDSTTVYQGAARKLDPTLVKTLNAFAVDDCIPDITFILDVDRKTAQSRLGQRGGRPKRDRMEEQPEEFYERVTLAYRALADRERDRVVLIDGTLPPDKISRKIWGIIEARFPALATNRESKLATRKN